MEAASENSVFPDLPGEPGRTAAVGGSATASFGEESAPAVYSVGETSPALAASAIFPNAGVYPYSSVCYILATVNGTPLQGSGVIIGPHTVLTASHLLWDNDTRRQASTVEVRPGFADGSGAAISGTWTIHFNQIDNSRDGISKPAAQQDYAVINFAADLSSFGWFGIQTGFAGGTVHLSGYPAIERGRQIDEVGTVSRDPVYSVLNYGTVSASPGTSGGPLWIDRGTAGNPQPYAVGVVSTGGWGPQLTATALNQIQAWQQADSWMWNILPVTIDEVFGSGNFAANGMADLAFAQNGVVVLWTAQSIGFASITVANARMGADWRATEVADFNADGSPDILWTRDSGDTAIWLMNGTRFALAGNPAGLMGPEWRVAGAGDLNADRRADIVWGSSGGQVAVWSMDGFRIGGFGIAGGRMGPEWRISLLGDFNGDQRQDLLWLSQTGGVTDWMMHGSDLIGFVDIGRMGTNWRPAGTGDVNGDGTSDIVWADNNNNVQIWTMSGGRIARFLAPSGRNGPEWQLKEVADFTGDGRADLLWLSNSGAAQIWLLSGSQVSVQNLTTPSTSLAAAQSAPGDAGTGFADVSAPQAAWAGDQAMPPNAADAGVVGPQTGIGSGRSLLMPDATPFGDVIDRAWQAG